MGGRRVAVEEAGAGEEEGALADRGDPARRGGLLAQEAEVVGIAHRRLERLGIAARHPQEIELAPLRAALREGRVGRQLETVPRLDDPAVRGDQRHLDREARE